MDVDLLLHKEVDLIQSCISRMANNSFLLKGWALSLMAIILTLIAESNCGSTVGLILFFVILCFWGLDAFFLMTERKYRCLYNWVISNRLQQNLDDAYSLDVSRFDKDVTLGDSILCKTALLFYLPILSVLLGVILMS